LVPSPDSRDAERRGTFSGAFAYEWCRKSLELRRSPTDAPSVAVNVQVNNTSETSNRVLARLDEMLARKAALPAPTEQPMQIELVPIKESVNVES
jgi:hypothetical protein